MWQANQAPHRVHQVHSCLTFDKELCEIDPLDKLDRFEEHDELTQAEDREANLHIRLQVVDRIEDHLKGFDQGQGLVEYDVLDFFIEDE